MRGPLPAWLYARQRFRHGLSVAEFGLSDQYASVLNRAEGDIHLAPWHAGSGAGPKSASSPRGSSLREHFWYRFRS